MEVIPDTQITALFRDGQFGGNSGCNGTGGNYKLDGSSITIELGMSTMMSCGPEIDAQEQAYQANLGNAATYQVNGDKMEMADASGQTILVYSVLEPASLTGTLWQATGYNNGSGGVVSVAADSEITAVFGEDGTLAGSSSGCNSYSTSYSVDGNSISIEPIMAATMMACPEPLMAQETQYLAALPNAATYEIIGDKLELRDAEGALQASYVAVIPTPLVGTNWEVTRYNNGTGGATSVIIGTRITAVFNEDGSLTGSGGCNNYNAAYEVDGDNITISPGASTMMACPSPEGVMEQETQYLAALEMAATYSIQADTLELRTSDGALAVSYTAVPEELV